MRARSRTNAPLAGGSGSPRCRAVGPRGDAELGADLVSSRAEERAEDEHEPIVCLGNN